MRYAHNPKVWNRLPPTVRSNYPGGKTAYKNDFPQFVSYRMAPSALPTATKRKRRAAAAKRRKAKAKYIAAGRVRRGTRRARNPGRPTHMWRAPAQRRRRKIATKRNPAIVRSAERFGSKVPFIGKHAGAAAGASVYAFGGAVSSVYLTKYLLAMDSIADYKATEWLKVRPHWAYAIGGVVLGALARLATPGDATTKRAAQIAVTSGGFGAAALLYGSSQEDLQEFIAAKDAEEAEKAAAE